MAESSKRADAHNTKNIPTSFDAMDHPNPPPNDTDRNAILREKQALIYDLEEVYALVETSHNALKHHGVLGLESIELVLSCAYNKIYVIQEKENKQLKAMQTKAVQS